MKTKLTAVLYPLTLFVLNMLVCGRLLRTEYLDQLHSIEGAFIALARYIQQHWPGYGWFPMWFEGMPFTHVYQPGLQHVVAAVASVFGISAASAYHIVTAITYSLGAITCYYLASRLSGSRTTGFCAGLIFSLCSPSLPLIRVIWKDTDGWWNARRLQSMVVYGEGPNITGLMLVMLALGLLHVALVRRRAISAIAAAAALAAVPATSWPSTVALTFAVFCYLVALDFGSLRKNLPRLAGIAVLAYGLACPFVLPSTVWTTLTNANAMGDGPTKGVSRWISFALLFAAIALLRVLMARAPFGLRFSVLFTVFLGWIFIAAGWFQLRMIPQPMRFNLTLEIGMALSFALAGQVMCRRWPKIRLPLAGLVVLFCCVQYVNYRHYGRQIIRRVDINKTVEYQFAEWFEANMHGERVEVPGTISFWMNAFTDTPQVSGCCEQSLINRGTWIAAYIIAAGYNSEQQTADITLLWLKSYAVHAIAIGGPQSREHYKAFQFPYRFEGRLPLLVQNGDDRVYRVPQRGPGLARVVHAADLVVHPPENGIDIAELRTFVAALDNPALPLVRTTWSDPNTATISGTLEPDQVLAVAVNFDPHWRAGANGREVPVRKDGLGFIAIEPRCSGACEVQLRWDAGWEARVVVGIALLAIASALFWWWKERRRETLGTTDHGGL